MKYTHIINGTFIDRPNRFIAHVSIGGTLETVHVKNTGRCQELLLPGVPVRLEKPDNPNRKTKYDLVAVYKESLGWVNIDSQAPNKVVKEWLRAKDFDVVWPEYRYGDSRIDFYMKKGGQEYLMEVKGCTLEREGVGYFPDAPTKRGVKHLRELAQASRLGYHCAVAGTGKPAWIPLCCSVCDPDGGSKRSATQCGDAAGVWNGLGGSRGGRCPCHIFAMCGGL